MHDSDVSMLYVRPHVWIWIQQGRCHSQTV